MAEIDPNLKKAQELMAQAEALPAISPQRDALVESSKHYLALYNATKPAASTQGFSLNGKRYQLDANGTPVEIADNSKPTVVGKGSSYLDANGNLVQSNTPYAVSAGSSVYDPATGKFTQAPQSPDQQLKTQVDYWDAQVKAGKLPAEQAKAQLEDWIARNYTLPKEAQSTAEKSATTEQTGDIAAANTNNNLRTSAVQNFLKMSRYRQSPAVADSITAALNRAGAGNLTSDAFKMDLAPAQAVLDPQMLQALHGISPYATYLNNAKANLAFPDAGSGAPAPSPAPAAAVPALPPWMGGGTPGPAAVQAALATTPYVPPGDYDPTLGAGQRP